MCETVSSPCSMPAQTAGSNKKTFSSKVGVDPLASSKGIWGELLGLGDFYYELGVRIIEITIVTRCVCLQHQITILVAPFFALPLTRHSFTFKLFAAILFAEIPTVVLLQWMIFFAYLTAEALVGLLVVVVVAVAAAVVARRLRCPKTT